MFVWKSLKTAFELVAETCLSATRAESIDHRIFVAVDSLNARKQALYRAHPQKLESNVDPVTGATTMLFWDFNVAVLNKLEKKGWPLARNISHLKCREHKDANSFANELSGTLGVLMTQAESGEYSLRLLVNEEAPRNTPRGQALEFMRRHVADLEAAADEMKSFGPGDIGPANQYGVTLRGPAPQV